MKYQYFRAVLNLFIATLFTVIGTIGIFLSDLMFVVGLTGMVIAIADLRWGKWYR